MATWRELVNRSRKLIIGLGTFILFFAGVYLFLGAPGMPFSQSVQGLLKPLGSFLAVTISLGFLYRTLVRPFDDKKLEERLAALLDQKIDTVINQSATFGFDGFESSLNYGDIFDTLRAGETLWWLDTYDPHYRNWLPKLKSGIQRGAKIKMLVMSPTSPLADLRADEIGEGFPRETFRRELSEFKENIEKCITGKTAAAGSIEVVEYMDLPCAPIYIVEDAAGPIRGWSSYFIGKATGLGFPHMRWKNTGEANFLRELHNYLVEKWKRNQVKPQGTL